MTWYPVSFSGLGPEVITGTLAWLFACYITSSFQMVILFLYMFVEVQKVGSNRTLQYTLSILSAYLN